MHPQHGHATLLDLSQGFAAMPTWMQSFIRDLVREIGFSDPDVVLRHSPPMNMLSYPPDWDFGKS
jgi:hypothetical protein